MNFSEMGMTTSSPTTEQAFAIRKIYGRYYKSGCGAAILGPVTVIIQQ
jgi:hypothetical protein